MLTKSIRTGQDVIEMRMTDLCAWRLFEAWAAMTAPAANKKTTQPLCEQSSRKRSNIKRKDTYPYGFVVDL
jgi:hypothetical protein